MRRESSKAIVAKIAFGLAATILADVLLHATPIMRAVTSLLHIFLNTCEVR